MLNSPKREGLRGACQWVLPCEVLFYGFPGPKEAGLSGGGNIGSPHREIAFKVGCPKERVEGRG